MLVYKDIYSLSILQFSCVWMWSYIYIYMYIYIFFLRLFYHLLSVDCTYCELNWLAGPKCHWFSEDDWGTGWECKFNISWLVCYENMNYLIIWLIYLTNTTPPSSSSSLPLSFFVCSGKFLSALPVDPKLGKMLIMGAVFRCFDPVLTIVSGLSVRDPFLLPQDKKDVCTESNILPASALKCTRI